MNEENQQSVAYNLSLLQIQEVFRLLQKANDYYLNNKFAHVFHALRCAKMSCIQNLSQEERNLLDRMEKDLDLLVSVDNIMKDEKFQNPSKLSAKESSIYNIVMKVKKNGKNLRVEVEKYKEILMDILESHGYLIKKMEDIKSAF